MICKATLPTMQNLENENQVFRDAAREAQKPLRDALKLLNAVLRKNGIITKTPVEALTAMESTVGDITAALGTLEACLLKKSPATVRDGPTAQQGQFLAYISKYIQSNHFGVAPAHSALQRFFNLTAPSVNSMLVRLEKLGFIRRIPRQARAIELTIDPRLIPPLDRPFKI